MTAELINNDLVLEIGVFLIKAADATKNDPTPTKSVNL
jgi:hypothetical protein